MPPTHNPQYNKNLNYFNESLTLIYNDKFITGLVTGIIITTLFFSFRKK
jgi:uncharacterized membrane protein